MSTPDLSALIDATFELEGLLSLAQRPSADLQVLLRLIARKASYIAETADSMTVATAASISETPTAGFYSESDNSATQTTVSLPSEKPTAVIETANTAHDENTDNDEESNYSDRTDVEKAEEPPLNEPLPPSAAEAPVSVINFETENISEPADSAENDNFAAASNDNVLHFEFDYPDDQNNAEDSPSTLPYDTASGIASSFTPRRHVAPEEPKKMVRGLRTLFSINDKFRFRRELFNNKDHDFSCAIDNLQSFDSIADAEDYLYSELQLDPDNSSVKEFISLIDKYYSQI